jgi:hypothetical protein
VYYFTFSQEIIHSFLFSPSTATTETTQQIQTRKEEEEGPAVGIWESRADRVFSFKRRYRRRTKRSERPGGREKSRVNQARRPGEAKRNQDLAEKEATLWIP